MKLKRILKWSAGIILLALIMWFQVAYWTSTNDCDHKTAAPNNPMKAITYCDYGLANLKLETIDKPTPNDDQVLVRVRAASVNPYDWHFVEGTPKIMRAMGVGLRKPKDTRLGVDFAGTATGSVALKPASIAFEQAASANIAGITALQAVRDKGKLGPGQKVLINGASGGVGTFAVQIAKSLGADVTGVCSTRNVDLVRSLGADHVIDYTKEDFAKGTERYDAILDNVPNHTLSECRRVLSPKGKYVLIGGGGPNDSRWIGPFGRIIKTMVLSPFISQEMGMMMADTSQKDLTILADLMQSGKVKPVIDRTYKLSEVPAAIAYVEEGHARGKVIITID